MPKKILVVYASVSGSTGEVAEAIAEVLREADATVEVAPVRDVAAVSGYDAVVMGSSIRAGRWLPEAFSFLETHRQALSQIPVAYFTTCLTMVNNNEEARRTVLAYMEPVRQKAPEIKPVGLGLFAGSLDPNRQRLAMVQPGLAPQGDYRDWDSIRAWAAEIRPALMQGVTEPEKIILLRDAILSYTDMSGLDLQEADLHGATLQETNLSAAKLRRADLGESDLLKAHLHKADLDEAKLQRAGLNWAQLNWAKMSKADLSQANLIGANLSRANLEEADLSHSILNGANLGHANLSGANLRAADLNWADLHGADLSNADLSGANLGWANLSEANLENANLSGVRYNSQTKWPEDFSVPTTTGAIYVGDL